MLQRTSALISTESELRTKYTVWQRLCAEVLDSWVNFVDIQRQPLRPESRAATGMTRRIANGIGGNVRG